MGPLHSWCPALHTAQLQSLPWLQGAAGGSSSVPHTPAGLAYPFHYGALRPAMATAFLGLVFANQTTDAAYAGRLFNYAAYQVSWSTFTTFTFSTPPPRMRRPDLLTAWRAEVLQPPQTL